MRRGTTRPKASCHRGFGLRSLLTLLVFSSIGLPLALGSIVANLASSGLGGQPSGRFYAVRRELAKAVEPDGSGGLVARPGYKAPEWLTLVVSDKADRIVYSGVADLPAGADTGELRNYLATNGYDPPSAPMVSGREPVCVYVETVELGGQTLGYYYALAWPVDVRGLSENRGPYYGLLAFGCFALVAIMGAAIVSAVLAGSVMRLEKAAVRIAGGDLETAVQLGGIREMASLAVTMDGMRKTLREDRDRRARFLAAVSHDLRTPLTSIGGYLEAVEDGLAGDPATLARYVGIMQGKTRLLEDRIQGLIEFARMETGEWRVGFRPLDLGAFLEARAREFSEDARLRGLCFECAASCLCGLALPADEALLGRVFENLVSNAFRHSPPGGLVRLSARLEGPAAMIDLDDEGPGIPVSDRELVFEPFYRGVEGAKSGDGSGLGLYIARSVVRGHGWNLAVSAAPSGGARFTVMIPMPAGTAPGTA